MAAKRFIMLTVAILLMTHSIAPSAQDAREAPAPASARVRYTLRFPAPHTHYVEVAATVPTGGRPEIEMTMAVWTPGSYLVREFERNVEDVTASAPGGAALNVSKAEKNRWRVTTGGATDVTVRYRVYGREMSVRTNWIEAGFALINGAPTFMTLVGGLSLPHEVDIVPADGWNRSMSGLAERPGGSHRFSAPDYDTLVDSPILVGNPAVHEFTIDGKPHYLVNEGEAGLFDGARAARDLEAIVHEYRRMWGALPYDKYVFFNLLTEAGGGLEHRNSTVLMASRWATRTPRAYTAWLDLASHEYFHLWNVKRLRPVELGPFDYEQENHTRSLWIAEGITDYYANLAVHRAGLITRDEFIESLANKIEELQTTPGRLVQSVAAASYDAWIKYYRPDENSANTSISYYTKGAVLGFLLDAKVRAATSGAKSLDDVMRAAYERFAGARGYTPEEFQRVAEQVAGTSLQTFWDRGIDGTDELDYSEAFELFGLRFRPAPPASTRPWLGLATRNDAGRLVVAQVRRDSPASTAGLNVDDEILAVDDFRVRADRLDNRLEQYKPGDRVSLLVARREQLMRLDLTFGSEPPRQWRLERAPDATAPQMERMGAWLKPAGSL